MYLAYTLLPYMQFLQLISGVAVNTESHLKSTLLFWVSVSIKYALFLGV